jgi:hypothetical protein
MSEIESNKITELLELYNDLLKPNELNNFNTKIELMFVNNLQRIKILMPSIGHIFFVSRFLDNNLMSFIVEHGVEYKEPFISYYSLVPCFDSMNDLQKSYLDTDDPFLMIDSWPSIKNILVSDIIFMVSKYMGG